MFTGKPTKCSGKQSGASVVINLILLDRSKTQMLSYSVITGSLLEAKEVFQRSFGPSHSYTIRHTGGAFG